MTMRGAHGIAVDAARRDLVAPAALDGVVNADHDRAVGREPVEDHQQQFAADGGAVPSRPAEHVVVAREIVGLAEADDTQRALTVRFPGASVMPVTSASTWSQTGAVKKLRKGAISAIRIDGAIGAAANEEEGRCRVIATVESSRGECALTPFKPRLRHFNSVRPDTRTRTAPRRSTTMAS